ncbi:unnamed protein product, partial [Tetraodon nigroviridis]
MSISVTLLRVTNLPGRSDRKVELSFRGFTHKTRVLQCENLAIFNEVADSHHTHVHTPMQTDLVLTGVYVRVCTRLLGKLVVSLQHVVSSGRMWLRERLTDSNLSPTDNFQFEFQEYPEILFDKVIELKVSSKVPGTGVTDPLNPYDIAPRQVCHRRTLAFLLSHIGSFKIDLSTVYKQPDHRFYQKWAPLTDPADTRAGIKGYVKTSVNVLMKGDSLSMPSLPPASTSGAQDHIEKNLMLPRGMISERPWARFHIRIYKAEGLPTMDSGLMAKMAVVSDRTVFIDPYVRATFAGQQGETSVVPASSCPVWNEEISFIEQFPPLAQRIRVQILDDAKMGDVVLATHFLDLQQISDPTRNGFNPIFGPSWVNLYGSPQNSTLRDVHQALNEGLGEGIFYRGRILLGLSVEVYSSHSAVTSESSSSLTTKVKGKLGRFGLKKKSTKGEGKQASRAASEESEEAGPEVPEAVTVVVEETHPLPEGFLGEKEDFLLFASLFEVTMMDPCVGTKPVKFELSIGNCGKAVEVGRSKKSQSKEDLRKSREDLRRSREDLTEEGQNLLESEDELDKMEALNPEPEIKSVTAAMRAEPTEYDRSFYCIPLQPASVRQKPCLFIWTQFEDHNFRLYQTNWLCKMADRLEMGLDEVERLFRRPRSKAKERLVEVLLELVATCKQFSVLSDRRSHSRPNKLDRCRRDFIKKNLVSVSSGFFSTIPPPLGQASLPCLTECLTCQILLARQAVRTRRRVTRRTVKQRLMESRKFLKTLRLLAKEPQSTIPDVFLWLLRGTKRLAYVRVPAHSILFSLVEEQRGRNSGRVTTLYLKAPGGSVSEIFAKLEVYMWLGLAKSNPLTTDSRYFQLRCHLYQGRGLMAAEDNGLSSPFAKVVFSTQCLVTRVLHETLSPAWCETLLFDRVLMEGIPEQLRQDPPLIVINIYSHSSMGCPKPLGRAFAEPEFKTVDQLYKKPHLRFFDVNMGKMRAGELLASFELIELDSLLRRGDAQKSLDDHDPGGLAEGHQICLRSNQNHRVLLLPQYIFSFSRLASECQIHEMISWEPCLPQSVDPQELTFIEEEKCYIIPEGVRPVLRTFRIEVSHRLPVHVLFWGLRELKRVELFEVSRPFVRMECAGHQLESEEVENFKLHPNFKEMVRSIDVELPEQAYLHPPLTIFVLEQRAFASMVVQTTLKVNRLNVVRNIGLASLPIMHTKIPINPLKLVRAPLSKLIKRGEDFEEEPPEKEELDWWSKYYASLEEIERKVRGSALWFLPNVPALQKQPQCFYVSADARNLTMANIDDDDDDDEEEGKEQESEEADLPKRKMIATLKLYGYDLESEFSQFQDWLRSFPLYKGRANAEDFEEDEEERLMGKYKGSFLVYPIDEDDTDDTCQITKGIPTNSAIKALVRVYIVKATNLAPSDPNGKADPYLVLRVGQQVLDTKDRYIPKELNPTFGEVFEFTVSFPLDTELSIRVMDHDLVGTDDIIGETHIDLENRFYSSHRASCGLALYYDVDGYNKWRDAKKPTTILAELCRSNDVEPPEYRPSEVKVLNKIFKIPPDAVPEGKGERT